MFWMSPERFDYFSFVESSKSIIIHIETIDRCVSEPTRTHKVGMKTESGREAH